MNNQYGKEDPLIKELNKQLSNTNKYFALMFILGFLFGIVTASFLHKFIVHPLGW